VLKEHPDLQPADGSKSKIEWIKNDRFDDLIFYGHLPSDPSAGVGIYVGAKPSFKPPPDGAIIKGKLGAYDVNWYLLKSDKPKFYRTCLIDYQTATVRRGSRVETYVTQRHVWVYADTESGLETIMTEVGKMKMFSARRPDLTM